MSSAPYNIKSDYGFLHIYALTMTLGIAASVLACYIKSQKKELPSNVLLLSVIVIVPSSLLSASFFGKVDFPDFHWSEFFSYFEFWNKSGGMSIHGGVLGGVTSACLFYIYPSKKYKISLWVWFDTIIPNVLLGQAIGRWGNFFNHELLGLTTSLDHLSWLPNWISHNCWQWSDGSRTTPEAINGIYGTIQYRQPIFLYESFFDFTAWMFITFTIPNLGKLLGPKPWKKYSQKYSTSFSYSFKVKLNKKNIKSGYMTYNEIWNDVYYEKEISEKYVNSVNNSLKYNKQLIKLHNPDGYWIVKAGAAGGSYFLLWNVIRLTLETQRQSDQLFLHNLRTIDYSVIASIGLIGLILILVSQFISPYFFRKQGWMYEKEF